jgi:hypothetical protein
MKFKVTQIFRDGHDNLDDDVKIIEADNKEEAEKIYWEKNFRIKGFYKLTVEPMKENNEFKRIQELAGIIKENPENTFKLDRGNEGMPLSVKVVDDVGYRLSFNGNDIFITFNQIEKLYEDIDKYIQKDEDSEEGTIGY